MLNPQLHGGLDMFWHRFVCMCICACSYVCVVWNAPQLCAMCPNCTVHEVNAELLLALFWADACKNAQCFFSPCVAAAVAIISGPNLTSCGCEPEHNLWKQSGQRVSCTNGSYSIASQQKQNKMSCWGLDRFCLPCCYAPDNGGCHSAGSWNFTHKTKYFPGRAFHFPPEG